MQDQLATAPLRPATWRVLIADYKNADISADMPRLFKQAGCIVDVYCDARSWLLKNRSWDSWCPAQGRAPEEYARGLIRQVQLIRYDWVILADDPAVRIMQEAISDDELARRILPLSKLENRELLGSKAALSRLCTRHGLLTPTYAIPTGTRDAMSDAARIGYPLLVKIDKSGGGSGVFFCDGPARLAQVLADIPAADQQDLMLQAYVVGDTVGVEALYRRGILLGYACASVLETVSDEFSVSSIRRYVADPDMAEELGRAGEALGFDGFVNFTYMRERDSGLLYLIEADVRPQGWFFLARHCGVDFSEAIRNYLSGSHALVRQPDEPGTGGVVVRHFFRCVNRALERGDLLELLRWCVNADGRWRFLPLHDRRVACATLMQLARTQLLRMPVLRKLRGYDRSGVGNRARSADSGRRAI